MFIKTLILLTIIITKKYTLAKAKYYESFCCFLCESDLEGGTKKAKRQA